jgi:mannose-1-phosphate guanylyltransferase/mannose-6-phosphate isomerase
LPLQAGWSDVGAWDALWQVLPKDDHGNVAQGDVMLQDCRDTLALSDDRLLACVGVSDLVVVATPDAILVAHKDKHAGRQENRRHAQAAQAHRGADPPQGVSALGLVRQRRRGRAFPGQAHRGQAGGTLSLQMHHHRAEHWIVVSGTAKVTKGGETFLVSENESTYIPLGTTHRLENPGRVPLEMIEVQSGSYLGEDDIVRFEDVYGRIYWARGLSCSSIRPQHLASCSRVKSAKSNPGPYHARHQ